MAHIGDLVPKSGLYTNPGVVVDKHRDGTVTIDTEPLSIHKYHRYSNTTGLTHEEKDQFNAILDQIYANEEPMDRMDEIQVEIDRLRADPKNANVVQYLRNQQATMIRDIKKLPRYYGEDEAQINT